MSTICDGCGEYMGDCECEAAALSSRTDLLREALTAIERSSSDIEAGFGTCHATVELDLLAARIRKELGDE